MISKLKLATNLSKRVISALVMLPIVILIIVIGGWLFNLMAIIITALMIIEIYNLLKNSQYDFSKKWQLYIILYTTIPSASLISLRELSQGMDIIIYLCFIVWITDISAYFGGKNFAGPKLAPKISPNKTISGAITALISVLVFSILAYFFTHNIDIINFILIGIFLSIISQIGDLFESWIKRKLKVKDSGNIIPGHGGICDRIDGLIFVLPVAYLIFAIFLKNIF